MTATNISRRPVRKSHGRHAVALPLLAGIELGGTKAVALLARGGEVVDATRMPTSAPEQTLTALTQWLGAARQRHGAFAALGIASFGPLGLDPRLPDYGFIMKTPKPGWEDIELVERFGNCLDVPVELDTDVNGAALAEGRWGAAQGADVHAYLTLGTGVGLGIVVNGRAVHGAMHPEFGHIRVRRRSGDSFRGSCPWHGDCLEGLVSGPAIALRAGRDAANLPANDPVWDNVIADLAEGLAMLVLTISPQRIVVGGGVGVGQTHLIQSLRMAVADRLAGYLGNNPVGPDTDRIVPAGLGHDAGPMGAIALASIAFASD